MTTLRIQNGTVVKDPYVRFGTLYILIADGNYMISASCSGKLWEKVSRLKKGDLVNATVTALEQNDKYNNGKLTRIKHID